MQIVIPEPTATIFQEALEALAQASIPHVIGGAFAVYHYSNMWRNTNDLDVYLEREHVPSAVQALIEAGFQDYGEMAAGDGEWIFHGAKDGVLVDLIWQPPNRLAPVDESVFLRAQEGWFLGKPVRFLSADELMWTKIFTMNRDRCDWPDTFNIVRACPQSLNWSYLVSKIEEHWPVLLSFIILYDWAYPGETCCIPERVREELLRRKRQLRPKPDEPTRESILDPWIYTRSVLPQEAPRADRSNE